LEDGGSAIQSLETPTDWPLTGAEDDSRFSTLDLRSSPVPDVEGVIGWLRGMVRVLQSAACDADFFQKAAQAVVEVVRLDLGRVLTCAGDGWETAAFFPGSDGEYERSNPASRLVLNRVCQEKRSCWF